MGGWPAGRDGGVWMLLRVAADLGRRLSIRPEPAGAIPVRLSHPVSHLAALVAVRRSATRGTLTASDTTIAAQRFEDRDPVAKDELVQVVKACRVYGCRIGIQGLQPSRYDAFAVYLKGLGADSVTLSTETATGTTLAMLEIAPKKAVASR